MSRQNEVASEASAILSLLESLIVSKKIGIREFERRMKVSYGTLNRLFSGKIALKLQTVLDILDLLEVPHKAFFSAAFEASSPAAEELLKKVQSLTFPKPPPLPAVSRTEIKQIIEEVLSERQAQDHEGLVSPPAVRARKSGAQSRLAMKRTT